MRRLRSNLTYANVVSSLCLFLLLSGGAAFAASKIRAGDIAHGAVRSGALHQRAVTSGKLAVGAVRSNQLADGAVSGPQLASGAVGTKQIGDGAVTPKQVSPGSLTSAQIAPGSIDPSSLQVPLYLPASPTGDSVAVGSGEPVANPLSDATWTQKPGQINVIFAGATATLAYDGSGSGSCRVFLEIAINGKQVGGGEISTTSESLERIEQNIGAGTEIDPPAPRTNTLTSRIASNGDCTPDSVVNSTRFQVVDFG